MKNLKISRTLAAEFTAIMLLLATAGSALSAVLYVDVNSTNATPPFTYWATAATNIQDAVDAAVSGDEIVVTNGTYAGGVSINGPLTVRSVNGSQFTTVAGGGPCVSLASNASLSGFTVTGGVARFGGGVFCQSSNAVVSNCVITGNHVLGDAYAYNAGAFGGGAYGGTLNNCTLTGNSAELFSDDHNPGFPEPNHWYSAQGGGAAYCVLNNCALNDNSAAVSLDVYNYNNYDRAISQGGGAYYCTLNNCSLSGNSASADSYPVVTYDSLTQVIAEGGGTYGGHLKGCTLSGNSAEATSVDYYNAYLDGGGASSGTLLNCIVYYNVSTLHTSPSGGSGEDDCYSCTLNYCCTMPQPSFGIGNITNAPLFVAQGSDNLRLQSNSPCINAGNNAYAVGSTDLDGNPRVIGGTVDIGAYEYQSLSLINFSVVSNQVGFDITGQSNQVVIVEASIDLLNWSPLDTNTLSGHPLFFSDPSPATLPRRFYRAQAQ
jgi:hypothetical protein